MISHGIYWKALHLILLTLGSGLAFPAIGQEVAVYVTSKAGDRLSPKSPLHFVEKSARLESGFRLDELATNFPGL